MLWRLGVQSRGSDADVTLVQAIEGGLSGSGVEIDRFFFDWRGGQLRAERAIYDHEAFALFRTLIAVYEPASPLTRPYWSDSGPCSMHIDEVEAIWGRIADADDWSVLDAKVAAIRRMGEALTHLG